MDSHDEEICKLREKIARLEQKGIDDDKALVLAKTVMWSLFLAATALISSLAALVSIFKKLP